MSQPSTIRAAAGVVVGVLLTLAACGPDPSTAVSEPWMRPLVGQPEAAVVQQVAEAGEAVRVLERDGVRYPLSELAPGTIVLVVRDGKVVEVRRSGRDVNPDALSAMSLPAGVLRAD